ncbi:MAG: RNA polymerase sigma-70 factor (ECF subfamily) [Planctomycetota bacterium]|jgi:RNA polymerase sigma-70 factor (ECF subfamily)
MGPLGMASDMSKTTPESLFQRYRDQNDLEALAAVFDRTAPHLLAIARRLDQEHADDLLQETFLAAIQNAAAWDAGRPLTPWLLGILTRRAQRSWESKQRTPDPHRVPERTVEAPEAPPMAREFQASLEQAVSELAPPLRQAVEACLINGDSPSQLAVNLGLRPGTIRQRLSRGMGELRMALKGALLLLVSFFGLRSQGLAAVRQHVLQAAAGSQGMRAAAGPSMAARWTLAALVSATGIIAALSIPSGSHGPNIDSPEADLAALEPGPAPSIDSQAELQPPSPILERDAQELRRLFRVQVLRSDTGAVVMGRPVELLLPKKERLRATSDAQGFADFRLGKDQDPFTAVATPTPFSPAVGVYLRNLKANEIPILRVDEGGSLSGVVLDPNGSPAPGARVTAWFGNDHTGPPARDVLANAAGEFTVAGLGNNFIITASKGKQWVASHGLRGSLLAGDALVGHELPVAEIGTMEGVLLHPDGRPASGVKLTISHKTFQSGERDATHDHQVTTFMAGQGEATSNESGKFVIHGLPPGNHVLQATRAPYHEYAEYHALKPEVVSARFAAGNELAGWVTDANSKAIPNAEIGSWPYWGNVHTTPFWNTCAGVEGAFQLQGLSGPEQYGSAIHRGLIVRAPGYALQAVGNLPSDLEAMGPVRIQLLPEHTITGIVLTEDGKPAPGLPVRIEGDRLCDRNFTDGSPHTWEKVAGLNTATTDEHGRFQFDQLYPGFFQVQVFTDARKRHSLTQSTRSGHPVLSFHLTKKSLRKVVLRPIATDALTGEPIEEFALTHWQEGSGKLLALEAGEFGLEVSGVEPGEFGLSVSADKYVPYRQAERFFGTGEHDIQCKLYPVRSLRFDCRDREGKPISRFKLSGTGPDGSVIRFLTGLGRTSTHANIHNDIAHGLPAGKVSLHLTCEKREARIELDLTEAPGNPLKVVFTENTEVEEHHASVLFLQKRKPGPGYEGQTINGFLYGPEFPFDLVITRPVPLSDVRVRYFAVDPEKSKAENFGIATSGMKLESHWKLNGVNRTESYFPNTLAHPVRASFQTIHGSCTLHLDSEHYEPVHETWTPDLLDKKPANKTILLKPKAKGH